ncbi:MAG: MoxR family ATPase [Chthonomonadales bacterium]|nr:MoxR family ATPase [Chthonomonadales bacterium]
MGPRRPKGSAPVDISVIAAQARRIVDTVETAVVGKRPVVKSALATLLSNGHLLIEDIPGVGKTTLAKALARALGCEFKRIQFTPDLLPSDVTGTSIFNQKEGEFQFRAGPVFANIVLADEVNRATPKTQAALLECMEERQVTVDGVTYPLPSPFFVIATQNNIELSGTYPLPEAQLDRFTARLAIGYPGREDELRVLENQMHTRPVDAIQPVMSGPDVVILQHHIRDVHVDTALRQYVIDISEATRSHPAIALGASPRGSLALQYASQAVALMASRDYVAPDDIKSMAVPVLAHRIIVRPEQRIRGLTARECVAEILERVPVPVGAERAAGAARL